MPTLTTLVSFNGTNGSEPSSGLVADSAGDLFGTTYVGGAVGFGTVFEIAKTASGYASTPTTLVSFNDADGAYPFASLTADSAGDLFGTTTLGGANGDGTVFEIAKTASGYASTPTTLVSFNDANGGYPSSGLVADSAGDLFGTTYVGGALGFGTVFEIAKTASGYASTPTTLVSFNGADGAYPFASLTADSAGDLFGTTYAGGASGLGTVFEIAKTASGYASTPTTLVSFNGANGSEPFADLIADSAGDLFGTTYVGGASGLGTVFEIAKTASGYASTPTTLVSFNGTDGAGPVNGLIIDSAGDLFGTTYSGGASGLGTVFEIAKTASGYASTPTTLVSFNGTDGAGPFASLTADSAGDLFGTTYAGGASGLGTVFEITDSGFVTGFSLGDAANYAIIALDPHNFQGTSNSHIYGNVGVGPYQAIQLAGDTISGNLVTTGAPSPNTGGRVTGTITGHSASLATDIANLETLSSALGAESGTLTFLSSGTTLNATSGTPDSSGNDVFTVTHWADNLTLSGSSSDHVVLDIEPGVQFALGNVTLTGGLTPNHVLFNYLGTNEVHGINNEVFNGTILAPDAKINVNGPTINGHLFGGAPGQDFQFVGNANIHQPIG